MYVGFMILGRQKNTVEPLVPEPSAFEVDMVIEKLEVTYRQLLIKSQEN